MGQALLATATKLCGLYFYLGVNKNLRSDAVLPIIYTKELDQTSYRYHEDLMAIAMVMYQIQKKNNGAISNVMQLDENHWMKLIGERLDDDSQLHNCFITFSYLTALPIRIRILRGGGYYIRLF